MIKKFKLSKNRFYELLMLIAVIVPLTVIYLLVMLKGNAPSFIITLMTIILGFFYGIYPIVLLINYYSIDRSKEFLFDDDSKSVTYTDEYRSFTFLLSDIDSIVRHRSQYYIMLGYYTIYIKNKGYITASILTPITDLIDYAKEKEIYSRSWDIMIDMD